VRASAFFASVLESTRQPRVFVSDARRYVQAPGPRYDVIVADLFHPARSGSGALYTVEHFRAIRARLEEGGLFCQWLPLHQLDLQSLRSIIATFLRVYPSAIALLATHSLDTPVIGLVARPADLRLALPTVRDRIARVSGAARLAGLHLDDEYALLGSVISGPGALRRFAAGASLNTEDRPVIAQRAPFVTYAPDSEPRARLLQLLAALEVRPDELLAGDDGQFVRLAQYWRARDQFIALGTQVQPSDDVRAMLAQLADPLLAIVRESGDFRAAYDPLLSMAGALAQSDRQGARQLLLQLAAAQPLRPDASRWLERLSASEPLTHANP
jgi:spermidine synthase